MNGLTLTLSLSAVGTLHSIIIIVRLGRVMLVCWISDHEAAGLTPVRYTGS